MPKACSVVGCQNHSMMAKKLSFFLFPRRDKDPVRRDLWLKAVNRVRRDGSPWIPSKHTPICSDHFVTGRQNPNSNHIDYVPSLFFVPTDGPPRAKPRPGIRKGERSASSNERLLHNENKARWLKEMRLRMGALTPENPCCLASGSERQSIEVSSGNENDEEESPAKRCKSSSNGSVTSSRSMPSSTSPASASSASLGIAVSSRSKHVASTGRIQEEDAFFDKSTRDAELSKTDGSTEDTDEESTTRRTVGATSRVATANGESGKECSRQAAAAGSSRDPADSSGFTEGLSVTGHSKPHSTQANSSLSEIKMEESEAQVLDLSKPTIAINSVSSDKIADAPSRKFLLTIRTPSGSNYVKPGYMIKKDTPRQYQRPSGNTLAGSLTGGKVTDSDPTNNYATANNGVSFNPTMANVKLPTIKVLTDTDSAILKIENERLSIANSHLKIENFKLKEEVTKCKRLITKFIAIRKEMQKLGIGVRKKNSLSQRKSDDKANVGFREQQQLGKLEPESASKVLGYAIIKTEPDDVDIINSDAISDESACESQIPVKIEPIDEQFEFTLRRNGEEMVMNKLTDTRVDLSYSNFEAPDRHTGNRNEHGTVGEDNAPHFVVGEPYTCGDQFINDHQNNEEYCILGGEESSATNGAGGHSQLYVANPGANELQYRTSCEYIVVNSGDDMTEGSTECKQLCYEVGSSEDQALLLQAEPTNITPYERY